MLDRRGDDVLLRRIGHERGVNRGVIALSAATGEDDFLRVGIDERGDFFARLLDVAVDLRAERVGAGGVAPEFAEHRNHRLGHFRGDAGGGVVVEVVNFGLLTHKFVGCTLGDNERRAREQIAGSGSTFFHSASQNAPVRLCAIQEARLRPLRHQISPLALPSAAGKCDRLLEQDIRDRQSCELRKAQRVSPQDACECRRS